MGYYLDRQAEEIKKVEQDSWEGIDWQPLWDARNETIDPNYLHGTIDPSLYSIYLDTNNFEPDRNSLSAFIS